jgi:CNT family concentrative nucleoside transporter
MGRFTGVLGLLTMVGLAYAFSTNRRAIRMKTVAWGLGLQVLLALLVLKFPPGVRLLQIARDGVTKFLEYSYPGSTLVFGPLGRKDSPLGLIFAFQVLPTIIFIAGFFAVLYHYGIMQFIIRQAARVMTRLMGTSGAESLNVAASIFMGQTEAPLTIRPYLPQLTRSELMTVMTCGFAHVSGGIMGAYILYGIDAGHMLTAVIMTAPGTILVAKMLVPETEEPVTAGRVEMRDDPSEKSANVLGALAKGTTDGLYLCLNIAAMLIAFMAFIALFDGILGGIHNRLAGTWLAWFPESLEIIFGVAFRPVAWLIGIPWNDTMFVGNLLGTRMVLNEFIAFTKLGAVKNTLDPRTYAIATFALCGFANFSSIGIQIGGIGALAPNKKDELAKLGFRAMLAGTMANLMSASIVSVLL